MTRTATLLASAAGVQPDRQRWEPRRRPGCRSQARRPNAYRTIAERASRAALEAELLALKEAELAHVQGKRAKRDETTIRERCKSLYGFIEEFWSVVEPGTPFVGGWAIKAICDHLEAVTRGEIQNLLINVPPGMMKSLTVSVFWPAWEWGPCERPDLRYLTTSYSEDNVLRDSRKTKKIIESPKFQALWGEGDGRETFVKRSGKWGEFLFENTLGGVRDCRPFGSLTGGRGDRFICDDPHSTKTAESDTERAKTVRDYREGASDRLNDLQRSATVIIMQRLHHQDVAGTILELDVGFVHLRLPMEFEVERTDPETGKKSGGPCQTFVRGRLFFEDPRTEDGELLFPERFPRAEVNRLKKLKGEYAWAGQYQQRPAPREGGLFKRAWFQIVDVLPASCQRWVRAWDFGATEGGGDYTVGLKITRDADGVFYVTDVVREQLGPAGVLRLLKSIASQDLAGTTIRIPQDPAQAGKAQALTYVTELAGYAVKAVPPTGDKVTRATPASAQAEVGNVKLLRGQWNEAFMNEVCTFPAGSNDDQVDAFADALNELALAPPPPKVTVGSLRV